MACGTGSVASAVVSAMKNNWSGPVVVNVRSGENLEIAFERNEDSFGNIRLKGSAKVIFSGEYEWK